MNDSQHASFQLALAMGALQQEQSLEQQIMLNSFSTKRSSRMSDSIVNIATSSYFSQSAGSGSNEHLSHHHSDDSLDSETKLAKSRERNREHARRTRIRKKAHLASLQSRIGELQEERKRLYQKREECSIASILLGMASQQQQQNDVVAQEVLETTQDRAHVGDSSVARQTEGKRKRCSSDIRDVQYLSKNPMRASIDDELTFIDGSFHVNWKTGVCSDKKGLKKKLTLEQLKTLR